MGYVSPLGNGQVRSWVVIGLSLGAALFALPAQAAQEPPDQMSTDGEGTPHIVGGTTVPTCGWPTTVSLGGCTGTLIHPRVITTAAHCSPRTGQKISFGEKTPWAFTLTATKCARGMPGSTDWAYCILPDDDRLKQIPIIPPIHGCEKTKFLKPGATVTAVGFGITSANGSGVGTKRQVNVKVTKVTDGAVEVDGDRMHGLCHGDSGGPIFIHLVEGSKDYGWRAVGSTSGLVQGTGTDCAGGTRFMSLSQHIAQIEMTEKIDVTPCTDAMGNWAPGPDCKGVPTDPATGGGMWPSCMPGPVSGVIESCGPSTDPGPGGGDGGVDAAAAPDARPIADARDTGTSAGSGGSTGSDAGGGIADTGNGGGTGGSSGSGGSAGGSGGKPAGTDGGGTGVNGLQDAGSGCAVGGRSGGDCRGLLGLLVAAGLALAGRPLRSARRRRRQVSPATCVPCGRWRC